MPRRTRFLAVLLAFLFVLGACSSSKDKPHLEAGDSPSSTLDATKNACTDPVGANVSLVAEARDSVKSVPVYDAPTSTTPTQTLANPKLYNDDPAAPVPLIFLVKTAPDDNCQWLNVYLAQRPNGSTGWIKRSDVQVSAHEYKIETYLSDFKMKVYDNGQVIHEFPIAVATEDNPTPGGLYYTNILIKNPDPSDAYGPYAFGLSGYSETLSSFNGGDGQLGIHGTNEPEKIGTRVSHGCIRLHNEDITTLAETLPLGVPVQMIA